MLLFSEMMRAHVKLTFDKICMCIVAGLIVPFLLSSLIRILTLKIGRYVILIPFIVAFGSDAGAYFTGFFFGKHKMAPVLSQHKTIEGALEFVEIPGELPVCSCLRSVWIPCRYFR